MKKISALLIILTFYLALMPQTSFATTRLISEKQDEFSKKFREGRDLIDGESWAQAAEKFAEITGKYPNHKSADAALYWLAFCHKKQEKFPETKAAVERLIKDFPASSWVGDAKVLLLEISAQNRTAPYDELNKMFAESGKTFDLLGKSLAESGRSLDESGKSLAADLPLDGNPIEREDEIKLAAFQNLLASDPQKAIGFAGEALRQDSKASELLKRQIVRSFRHSRFVKTQTNGTTQYVRATTNIGREFIPVLREILKTSFQNESNRVVRNELIYALADISDPESIEYLVQTYSSTNDKEIKKTIIFSLGSPALSLSGTFRGTKITAEPLPAESNYNFNFEKLMEIFSGEKDPELKRAAFVTVQRFIRQSTTDSAIEKISRLYDAETDERFKISVINYFGNLKNKPAVTKLMDIAKNDPNKDLRFLAVYALRKNTSPEVVRFLEGLIK